MKKRGLKSFFSTTLYTVGYGYIKQGTGLWIHRKKKRFRKLHHKWRKRCFATR